MSGALTVNKQYFTEVYTAQIFKRAGVESFVYYKCCMYPFKHIKTCKDMHLSSPDSIAYNFSRWIIK